MRRERKEDAIFMHVEVIIEPTEPANKEPRSKNEVVGQAHCGEEGRASLSLDLLFSPANLYLCQILACRQSKSRTIASSTRTS